MFSSQAFKEGIHKWKVECLSVDGGCSREIGIATSYDFVEKEAVNSIWMNYGQKKDFLAYYYSGAPEEGNLAICERKEGEGALNPESRIVSTVGWNKGESMVITLDFEKGKLSFEKNGQALGVLEIDKGRTYYPGMSFYCQSSFPAACDFRIVCL